MKKKVVIIGAVLAAFLMLVTPTISAVNTNIKQTAIQEKYNLINGDIESLPVRNFIIRILGVVCIGLGIATYALMLVDPTTYVGMFGLCAVVFGIFKGIMNWLGGGKLLDTFFGDITSSFAFYLLAGMAYVRFGMYMLIRGQLPDENTKFPVLDTLAKIMSRGMDS